MKVLKSSDIKNLRDKWLNDYGNTDKITKKTIVNPTLDHDHVTGYCRAVLDRDTNQFLGKVESAFKRFLKHKGFEESDLPLILESTAQYLKHNCSTFHILHPQSLSLQIKRFSRLSTKQQEGILIGLGVKASEIKKTKNEKTKQYRKCISSSTNILKFSNK